MSRLCVKGLGPVIAEKDLKDLFSKKGEVTDVKVMRSKSGKSRQFAFVGFRSDVQAQEAKEYFHNTFLKTSRIAIEMAEKAKLGDKKQKASPSSAKTSTKEEEPTAKLAEGNEKKKEKKNKESKNMSEKSEEKKAGVEKDEFMEMMKSRKDGRSWTNDDSNPSAKEAAKDKSSSFVAHLKGFDNDEEDISDSDSDESYTEVDSGVSKTVDKGEDEQQDDKGSSSGKKRSLDAFIASLDSKEPQAEDDQEKEQEQEQQEEDEGKEDENEATSEEKQGVEAVAGKTRLFVKNIPFTCSEDELRDLFSAYGGTVQTVHISLDAETKTSRGIGFVQFGGSEEAGQALAELDGSSFQGRVLRVSIAESRRDGSSGSGATSGSGGGGEEWASTQDRWAKNKRSRQDADSGVNNAAYTSGDAVVQSLAASHDVKSSDILDVGEKGGDLAVRLAIGETKIVHDNKAYFGAHGVDLSALESALAGSKKAEKRSSTTILVKNLPHCPSYDDLESQFSSYGELMSFLVPPSRTVALVDFIEPSDARKAFQSLAYRRYKHTPLYLEWAPLGLVDSTRRHKEKEKEKEKGLRDTKMGSTSNEGQENGETNTLFLKNLDFSTTEEEVEQHLQSMGCGGQQGLRSVQIPRSKRGDGKSAGFCFVEFSDASHAAMAFVKVQKSKLGARVVEAEMCTNRGASGAGAGAGESKRTTAASASSKKKRKKAESTVAAASAPDATKISVRNVAFQATEGEIHSLFSTFGAVKRVKMPRKMDGTHRGFGFVEFSSHKEAMQALTSLSSTHLYGRHLILQWANPSSDDA